MNATLNDINQSVIVRENDGTLLLTSIPASTVVVGEKRMITFAFRRIEVTVDSIVDYNAAPEIVRSRNASR